MIRSASWAFTGWLVGNRMTDWRVAALDHEIVAAARFSDLRTQQENGKECHIGNSCLPGKPR